MDNNGFLEAGISPNRFLYQGKEWQTQLGLNLYDFHARQFDPALGRFLSADAASQFVSPYVGMGNVPTLSVDPDGNFAFLLPLLTTVLPTFTVTAWSTATTLAVIGGSALVAGGATLAVTGTLSSLASFGAGTFGGGCPPICPKGTTFNMDNRTYTTLNSSGNQLGVLGQNNPLANPAPRAYSTLKPIAAVPQPPSSALPAHLFSGSGVSTSSGFTLSAYTPGFFGQWA